MMDKIRDPLRGHWVNQKLSLRALRGTLILPVTPGRYKSPFPRGRRRAVKAVAVDYPNLQALFEVYAHIALEHTRYNPFVVR